MLSRPRRAAVSLRFRTRWFALVLALAAAHAAGCSSDEAGGGANSCKVDSDCAPHDDGDACNGSLRCDAALGVCALAPATIVTCDTSADTACSQTRCVAATGACEAVAAAKGTACDDGVPCTLGDRCEAGACKPGADACECDDQRPCVDDGNACNGKAVCDKAGFPYRCVVPPSTVVTCPEDDAACSVQGCDPKTGACNATPRPDGATCDDGDACTADDACAAGVCKGAIDICTCKSSADCKDDGDACNGVPYCDTSAGKGVCKPNPASVVNCSVAADTPCRKNTCDQASGACVLQPVNEGKACDDGDACTDSEVCAGGVCAGGSDVCKCKADTDCKDQDDGDACNGTLYCDLKSGACKVNPATVVVCPTVNDTACQKNLCQPKTGTCALTARAEAQQLGCAVIDVGVPITICAYKVAAAGDADPGPFACEDGDGCTKGDVCDGKTCKPGAKVCECTVDADCKAKDDGDLCNGTMFCDPIAGACKVNPATVVNCPTVDDTACVKNTCAPKTGVCGPVAQPSSTKCDDGDSCTSGDSCSLGACKPGTFVCECKVDADCKVKDDGNLCNGLQYCDLAGAKPACKPQPGSEVFCSKSQDTDCLKSTCNPKTGGCALAPAAGGTACDDGKPCTDKTTCALGVCGGGAPKACNDGDACTIDSCDAVAGCTFKVKSCDDGNACTPDGCDGKTGACKVAAHPAGTPCDADGSGCTVADACDGKGACKAGAVAKCDAKVGACEQALCQPKGSDGFSCVVTAQPDGTPCPDGDPCYVGAACKGGQCKPGATPTLWSLTAKPGEAAEFGGGVLRGDGVAVLAGQVESGADAGKVRVVALGPSGTEQWAALVAPPSGIAKLTAVIAVLDRGAQGVVVVARGATTSGAATAASAVIDAGGKVGTTAALTPADGLVVRVDRAVLHDSGNLVLAGVKVGDDGDLVVAMRTLAGAVLWQLLPDQLGQTQHVSSLRVIQGGGIVVWSSHGPWQHVYSFLTLDAGGNKGPSLVQGTAELSLPIGPLAVVAGGTALAIVPRAAYVEQTGKVGPVENVHAVRFALGAGAAVGARTLPTANWPQAMETVADRLVYVGVPGTTGTVIGAMDALGNPLWQRPLVDPPTAVRGLSASGDGSRVLVFGGKGAGAGARGAAQVVDRWGFASCAARGQCADKAWQACDDGNACTAEGCVAATGCQAVPDLSSFCDPKLPCTKSGSCASGACKPDHDGRVFVKGYGSDEGTLSGLVELDDGRPAVASRGENPFWQHASVAITAGSLADGSLADIGELGAIGLDLATRVVRNGAGVWAVLGIGASGDGHALRLQIQPDGPVSPFGGGPTAAIASITAPDCKGCKPIALTLIAGADGSFFGGGWGQEGGATSYLGRVLPNGQLAWRISYGGPAAPESLVGLGRRSNGGVIAVGQTVSGGKVVGAVRLVSSAGGTVGSWTDPVANVMLIAAAERPDGVLVAVGATMPPDGLGASLRAAWTPAGKLLWRHQPPIDDGLLLTSVLADADLGLTIAGEDHNGGKIGLRLLATDVGGALRWVRTGHAWWAQTLTPLPGTLRRLADGTLAVAGRADSANVIVRADASGYTSCLDAGKCAALALDACDDGNPCTADWCDAGKGCQHAALSGTPCVGGSCDVGSCKK